MARASGRRNKKAITATPTAAATSSRRITRSIYKKHMSQICRPNQCCSPSKPAATTSSTTTTTTKTTPDHGDEEDGFSTPKSEKNKIPDTIPTCPPAPKKPRPPPVNLSDFSQAKRTAVTTRTASPIAFFAHPDIELFFFYALRRDQIKV